MNIFFVALLGGVAALALVWIVRRFAGFPAQTPGDYEDGFPELNLRERLCGDMICEGVIYGPLGRVTSRFVADFDASWEGDIGFVTERFTYDDGSTQQREWHLKLGADNSIEATAPDVVGTGRGRQAGHAVQLRYRIRLPEDAGGHVLSTVDWMYLLPNGSIINRSQFRKFGIKVAELVATIRPRGSA